MTIHIVQGADGLTRRAFTADDVRRMVDAGIMHPEEPIELRAGEFIAMPAEKFMHGRTTLMIARKLSRELSDEWMIGRENTLQLGHDTLVQPDFFICPSSSVRPSAEDFLTVPGQDLLIIEVANSSRLNDRTRKADLYARNLVREYWIVDLNGRCILVHRRPEQGSYQTVQTVAADENASPEPPGPSLRLLLADLV
jgi:Uma2 family endonuclease